MAGMMEEMKYLRITNYERVLCALEKVEKIEKDMKVIIGRKMPKCGNRRGAKGNNSNKPTTDFTGKIGPKGTIPQLHHSWNAGEHFASLRTSVTDH